MKRPTTRSTANISTDPEDPVTAYALDVVSGRHIEGPYVRAACQRHLNDLASGRDRGLRWNLEAALRAINYFPAVLTVEGDEEPIAFELLPAWKFVVGCLFGWQRRNGGTWYRRFVDAYVEAGKGSGKSPLAAGIGLFMLHADGELAAEVYSAAGKKEQARILFDDAVAMVKRSRRLDKVLGKTGKKVVNQLTHHKSNSIFRPISSDHQKSGARVHCGLVDELHEHKNRYTVDMLKHGFKRRKQPLRFVITNSGFNRQSICWEMHDHGVKVVEGDRVDDRFFAFIMALDIGEDPLEDESCWEKTNPGIGVTITRDYLQSQVSDAREIPGRENDVRRLNFCEWTEAESTWLTRNTVAACEEQLIEYRDGFAFAPMFRGAECYIAVDLGFSFDLAAIAYAFPEGKNLLTWIEYFTPAGTAIAREARDRAPYPRWIKEGLIHGVPGNVVRIDHIAARLADVSGQLDIVHAAYDRYRHKDLEDKMSELGVDLPWIEHPQGFRRAGQLDPLVFGYGDDGKPMDNPLWMPGSVDQLETRFLEKTIRIHNTEVTRWNISNVIIRHDPAGTGNRVFDKRKSTGRIDGVVALAMGDGAAEMKLPKRSLAAFLKRPVMTK